MRIINASEPAAEAAWLRKLAAIPDSLLQDAKSIMKGVEERGDSAIIDYTAKFDGVRLESLQVSAEEIKQAYQQVNRDQVKAIKEMSYRLAKSEMAVLKRLKGIAVSSKGVEISRMVKPITSVGCYIPGGKARYPSTVVMCAVPAKVAGVKRVVAISPPRKDNTIDPLTLVTADICGVDEFYKAGG